MRHKRILSLLISLLVIFNLSGCIKNDKPITQPIKNNFNYPYTIVDSTGNEITLYEEPKKVAILFSSYAEIWKLAGGKADISVGESVERGFADKNCILVDTESGHTSINTELLISCDPDLVIGTADHEIQRKTADFCNENGIPAILYKIETFEDYLEVLKTFTDLLNNDDNYKTYGTDIKNQIDVILNKIPSDKETKKVLFIRSGSSARSAKAKTSNENFVCKMLNELGTFNIAENAPILLDGLSTEEILKEDPDMIFVSAMGDEKAAISYMDSLFKSDEWNSLTCVKDGNYYYLPKDLFHFKPNARWADAYYYLAKLIYTEIDFEQ